MDKTLGSGPNQPPDVAIGTPKLLSTLLAQGKLPLCASAAHRTLVLDEVDSLTDTFRWPLLEAVLEPIQQLHLKARPWGCGRAHCTVLAAQPRRSMPSPLRHAHRPRGALDMTHMETRPSKRGHQPWPRQDES